MPSCKYKVHVNLLVLIFTLILVDDRRAVVQNLIVLAQQKLALAVVEEERGDHEI